MEKELFALLRLGLGNTTTEEENLSDFIMLPAAQWARIGALAQEQGVLGVMLDGVERLEVSGVGATRELSKGQKLEWIGNVLNGYEARNQHQLAVIDDLQKKWSEAGLRMMVMKGQAMGTYYPNPKHRAPGDIDCYLMDERRWTKDEGQEAYKRGNEVARKWAEKVDEGWYKHSVISYKGETIENHQYFVHTREGKSSKQLNGLLTDLVNEGHTDSTDNKEWLLPPVMFNAVFLTYHGVAHFLEEGLRLKQILDWAMFLKRDGDKIDWKEFYCICEKFHFRRFADVLTDIAVRWLGIDVTQISQITQIATNSPYMEKVLQSTLYDKEYVFSSGQSGWANRWHIVKNLFKYRWKYHEIYQHSVLRQLWWYVVGFVFKTELRTKDERRKTMDDEDSKEF